MLIRKRRFAGRKVKAPADGTPQRSVALRQRKAAGRKLDLIAAYQRQICELEGSVTTARGKTQVLNTTLTEVSESRAHLRELFEYAPIGYVVHELGGSIVEMNRAASNLLAVSPGNPGNALLAHFILREDLPLWLEHLSSCRSHGQSSTELVLESRNGRRTPVQMVTTVIRQPASRPQVIFRTVLIDITDRRGAQTALAESQRDYHQLIDTVEGIVWEADAATLEVSFVSRYAERLLGYSVEGWTRSGFWLNRIYVDDRERVANQLSRAIQTRQPVVLEYRVVTADRRLVWLHDNVKIIKRDSKLRISGVAVDITERKLQEEQLRQAHDQLEQRVRERTAELRDKVADLEAFSYTLSHDMRSPIRAMQGYAAVLEQMGGENLGPQGLDFLRRIMKSAERLDLLVREVLDYSRIASAPVELKPVPLDALVENIVHDYPSLASPAARVEIQQPLPAVYGHEAFIGQALSNLLTNAVKFMPPDRTPHVRVWTEEAHPADPNTHAKDFGPTRWIRIWVEDNGVGIAPEDQKRIFRIFERIYPADKYEGTGIGLAIVQKAVERMGGRVGVQSSPGHGSKFWIELRQPQR